jgi:DNA-binding response OmpR family regulator
MVGVIAVVAANGDLAGMIARVLESIGHTPVVFATTAAFLGALGGVTPDLALTGEVGLVHAVRGGDVASDLPIILLTPDLDDDRLVAGLRAGADDHVSARDKPQILLARIAALLRRTTGWAKPVVPTAARVVFDEARLVVTIDDAEFALTRKEFRLAALLFSNTHRALSRRYLIDEVWGKTLDPGSRTLDTHMSRLKSKLGLTPDRGFDLAPVYGYGYRLRRTGTDALTVVA